MYQVRTRFAPSPTGFLHIGNVRTALFAWLLAKQNNGQFILRIEDTDRKREVEGSEQHIINILKSLNIIYDEGPDREGPYGPYRQSQRLDIYHQWALKLIKKGRAYADTTTAEQLEQYRKQALQAKKPFLFRDYRPSQYSPWQTGQPLRFLSQPKRYDWTDAVMGSLSAGEEACDDFIIIKSDGYPTYNFAHIIDDYLMKISHVIRSQEFLASTPKYLELYEAFNIKQPILATVPFVLSNDGKKKLSKRHSQEVKDILQYVDEGYLPEALVNFIATLGWNDGTTQEIFSVKQLIEKFSLERVIRSGAKLDQNRLIWMNSNYIRNLSLEELYTRSEGFWPAEAANFNKEYKMKVLSTLQDRIKYLSELSKLSLFFFKDLPIDTGLIENNKQLSKYTLNELKEMLDITQNNLVNSNFKVDDLNERLNSLLTTTNSKPAVLFSLIRIAVTQTPASPGLSDTLAVLGRQKSLSRIQTMLTALN